jgi:hypothetical protein
MKSGRLQTSRYMPPSLELFNDDHNSIDSRDYEGNECVMRPILRFTKVTLDRVQVNGMWESSPKGNLSPLDRI